MISQAHQKQLLHNLRSLKLLRKLVKNIFSLPALSNYCTTHEFIIPHILISIPSLHNKFFFLIPIDISLHLATISAQSVQIQIFKSSSLPTSVFFIENNFQNQSIHKCKLHLNRAYSAVFCVFIQRFKRALQGIKAQFGFSWLFW